MLFGNWRVDGLVGLSDCRIVGLINRDGQLVGAVICDRPMRERESREELETMIGMAVSIRGPEWFERIDHFFITHDETDNITPVEYS